MNSQEWFCNVSRQSLGFLKDYHWFCYNPLLMPVWYTLELIYYHASVLGSVISVWLRKKSILMLHFTQKQSISVSNQFTGYLITSAFAAFFWTRPFTNLSLLLHTLLLGLPLNLASIMAALFWALGTGEWDWKLPHFSRTRVEFAVKTWCLPPPTSRLSISLSKRTVFHPEKSFKASKSHLQ